MGNIKKNMFGKAVIQRRRWNQTAIDCLDYGLMCSICPINKVMMNYEDGCQMKATVFELIKLIGRPPEVIKNKYRDFWDD